MWKWNVQAQKKNYVKATKGPKQRKLHFFSWNQMKHRDEAFFIWNQTSRSNKLILREIDCNKNELLYLKSYEAKKHFFREIKVQTPQCGNYENLLSHFLHKNFVKAMFSLKELRIGFTKKIEKFVLVHPQLSHTVNHSHSHFYVKSNEANK